MQSKDKPKPKKCYNCKHASDQFKVGAITHVHCFHPKYKKEDFESGKLSPWDTLNEFWYTCNDHEFKN